MVQTTVSVRYMVDDVDKAVAFYTVFEAEDFGPALTPKLPEQEECLRTQVEQHKHS